MNTEGGNSFEIGTRGPLITLQTSGQNPAFCTAAIMTSHTDTSLTQRPLLSAETVNGLKNHNPTEPFSATRPDVAAVLQASRLELPAIMTLEVPGFQIKGVIDEETPRLKTLTEKVERRLLPNERITTQTTADALEDDKLLHLQSRSLQRNKKICLPSCMLPYYAELVMFLSLHC